MVGHTRRFNPSHQYVHNCIVAGELNLQRMDVQTYFVRRKNMNAKGEARNWTDHLAANVAVAGLTVPAEVLAAADALINQQTVAGHRYAEAMRKTIDTEDFG